MHYLLMIEMQVVKIQVTKNAIIIQVIGNPLITILLISYFTFVFFSLEQPTIVEATFPDDSHLYDDGEETSARTNLL